MSSKAVNCGEVGVSRMISPNSLNVIHSGSNRKQGILSSPIRSSGQSFELKGENTESLQPVFCETKLTISSLKIRLAPTIQNTLATAVDSLLSEVAVVLDDALSKTRQELVTQEQENQRLRLRLEVSELEFKALQECLCSAQRIIDHLPASLPGLGTLGQQGFSSSAPSACGGNNAVHRGSSQSFSNQTEDGRDIPGLPGSNSEISGSFSDNLQGFYSGDDLKVCQLSIQADGTVSNNLLNTFSTSSPSPWSDIARPDECASEQMGHQGVSDKESRSSGLRSEPKLEIKQEQDQGPGQHGRGSAAEGGVPVAAEGEQTARNVAELGYIHVVEEEDASRSHSHAVRPIKPPHLPLQWLHKGSSGPFSDGLKTLAKPHHGTRPGQVSLRGAVSTRGPSTASPATEGGERPHLCLQCGKTFRLISSLKKHIRIHTGEKPYPCPVCGRCFRESGALKTHQRIHTGEKPYSCSDCGTCFRHLDGLRKHRRTHTGEKPYVCGVCGKRLSRLQHLKHHQRIHTGERPCRCPRCHKGFKEPAALRKHLRTHREEPEGMQAAAEDVGQVGAGPGAASNISQLHHLVLPPQMGLGVWGADGEDGVVMNCV
ncbi:hypothetical protein SKAU_G00267780 [Synaphobranchus kaupii]|uniref:C2H2-type domain-containing protein n=1 Tax=Synaphobranchus kaupii TaxID=118154 RepID=A0A9Q1EZK5_SYNKA|nr:hypothetical protein SKAU_G00267780 [Synaphobranchus kaupii]